MKQSEVMADQIAALPIRQDKSGKLYVLMVTSRDTGRWVMPKGWLMNGKKPWRAAEIEALEEAGAVGSISDTEIGVYHYAKRLDDGSKIRCRVTVYPMMVKKLKRRWKERKDRKRRWFSPKKAAKLVNEKELAEVLKALTTRPEDQPGMEAVLKAS